MDKAVINVCDCVHLMFVGLFSVGVCVCVCENILGTPGLEEDKWHAGGVKSETMSDTLPHNSFLLYNLLTVTNNTERFGFNKL